VKLPQQFRFIVLTSLAGLYFSGAITWILDNWFLVNNGLGPEPSPFHTWWREIHSIISLSFMVTFGYLLNSHVRPAWRTGRRLKSGFVLTAGIVMLLLTVPALFYLADESLKSKVVFFHTYFGLVMLLPFAVHYFSLTEK
jgi:hypothetical protein